MVDVAKLNTYVKIGEELFPLAEMTVESIVGLATQHDNTDLVARLTANKAVIDEDQKTVSDELAALDAEEGANQK